MSACNGAAPDDTVGSLPDHCGQDEANFIKVIECWYGGFLKAGGMRG